MVGTVEFSDHPAAAKRIPRIGNAFRIDFERVLASHPDVVLAWEPGTPELVISRLRKLGLKVVVIKTYRIADIAAAVRSIGLTSRRNRHTKIASAPKRRRNSGTASRLSGASTKDFACADTAPFRRCGRSVK